MLIYRSASEIGKSSKLVFDENLFSITQSGGQSTFGLQSLVTQLGHLGRVTGADFSADGRLLLTVSNDNTRPAKART